MILIWRGWGVVSAILALLGLAAGAGIGSTSDNSSMLPIAMGTGLFIGGAAGAVFGHWINVIRPVGQVDQARQQISDELWARVHNGQFQVAPGVPAPQNQAEAEQQIAAVMERYEQDFKKYRNRNTLFWIPMQYASAGLGAIGLVVLAIGAIGTITG